VPTLPVVVTVVTWNLLWAPTQRVARTRAASQTLAALAADVVLLQEVYFPSRGPSTADTLAHTLGLHVAVDGRFVDLGDGSWTGLAVLARHRTGSSFRLDFPRTTPTGEPLVLTEREAGRELRARPARKSGCLAVELRDARWGGLDGSFVASTHLCWGAAAEAVRLAEVQLIDALAADLTGDVPGALNPGQPDHAFVLGGDFNAPPNGDSVRWLCGAAASSAPGTYWIDAHAARGSGPGFTSLPSDGWGARTARAHGLDPELLPPRRIDYVLTRGWRWGLPGCPLTCRAVELPAGLAAASDHRPVAATLLA
jgi:endonuclease/exonuclease/phosphatase family metal-dependent hydrolase